MVYDGSALGRTFCIEFAPIQGLRVPACIAIDVSGSDFVYRDRAVEVMCPVS
jgi:hypothetical protein